MTESRAETLARFIVARRVVDQALAYSVREWQYIAYEAGLGDVTVRTVLATIKLLSEHAGSTKPLPSIDREHGLRGFTG